MKGKTFLWIVLALLAIVVLYFLFVRAKSITLDNGLSLGIGAGLVRCDPARPGYTMKGDFSIQCAGAPQCQIGKPGYDVNDQLQSLCGVPCDPNNLSYDVNGNFNMLCGGGVNPPPPIPCDPTNPGYDMNGNFRVDCAGGNRLSSTNMPSVFSNRYKINN